MTQTTAATSTESARARLVYVLAASHSGSTLLGMLLGSHPELCTVGELKATSLGPADEYRCSCRQLLKQCSFWRRVAEEMAAQGFEFDIADARTDLKTIDSAWVRRLVTPLHRSPALEIVRDTALTLSPTWRRDYPKWAARNAALVRALLAITGKRAVVDTSKIGVRLKYLLRNPELDVRVVRLVRDGRAVALTYIDPGNFADATDASLRGGGTGHAERHRRLSMEEAAREWRRSNEEAAAVVSRLTPDRRIEVRYEELCASPRQTLDRILSFVEVEQIDLASRFRTSEQHVIGNGMRLDSTSAVRLDDRWRSVLDRERLDRFNSVAGDLNVRLGYV